MANGASGNDGRQDHDDSLQALTRHPSDSGAPGLGARTAEYLDNRPTREPAPEVVFGFRSTALPGSDVRVVTARVTEALCELYEAVIELATGDLTLEWDALLGARAVLEFNRGPRRRTVCGVVRRLERLESWGGARRARVHLVPALWALSQRTNCRVFQNMSAPEILPVVLEFAGLPAGLVEPQLARTYPAREYTVQHHETDLAFVMRLLEDEGIAFWFRHENEAEVLVLSDGATWSLAPTIDRRAVPYAPPSGVPAPVEVVERMALARELRSTSATVRDYDFTRPLGELDMTRSHPRGDAGPRASFEYPGRFTLGGFDDARHAYGQHDGARRATLRHDEVQATAVMAQGGSNVTGFVPGKAFALLGHEHPDLDGRYLLTRVEHEASAPEELMSEGQPRPPSRGAERYRNTFECVPAKSPWVPARRTPRPQVSSTQTALVVGPAGEEIYTDHYGRIKVQFHWDRVGLRDEYSSCWVRVAQTWAGQGFGFVFVPRIGMEVVVSFVDGDPDRPLVVGCVYNGTHWPPEALPEAKTRSAIRTSSTPGGQGYNEIAFEDRSGDEQLLVHAHRNYDEVVGLDRSVTVARHSTETIAGDQSRDVTGADRARVGGDRERAVEGQQKTRVAAGRSVDVGADDALRVGGNRTVQVGGRMRAEVEQYYELQVGTEAKPGYVSEHIEGLATRSASQLYYVISGEEVVLECGTSSIQLLPDKIVLKADAIELAGRKTVTLTREDGPGLTLTEDNTELLSKKFQVFSDSAALEMEKEVKVAGDKIHLGYDPSKPSRDDQKKEPETQPFKCRMTDYHLEPLANRQYQLTCGGLRFQGKTDGDGQLSADVPKGARTANIRLWLDAYPQGRQQVYNVQIAPEVPPADDPVGAKTRLANLGYYRGPLDADETAEYHAAIASFQQDHKDSDPLTPSGDLDGATAGALSRVHGS